MGVLQFIIFGLKTRDKDYGGAYPDRCTHCDNDVYQHAYQWRRWFHVFWIPLVPWRANRALVCPICGVATDLEKSAFKQAKRLARAATALEAGEGDADEFVRAMQRFEAEAGLSSDLLESAATGERAEGAEPTNELAAESSKTPPVVTTDPETGETSDPIVDAGVGEANGDELDETDVPAGNAADETTDTPSDEAAPTAESSAKSPAESRPN